MTLCDPKDGSTPGPQSFTVSRNLLRFMSLELVMLSNYLTSVAPFSSCPQSFPASGSFPMSLLFTTGRQSTRASASSLPMNIQGWFPFRLTGFDLLAVQGTLKSLLQHHSSKIWILKLSAFFMVQLSQPYMTTGKTLALTIWTFVGRAIFLLFNTLSRFVIAFLPRSRCLKI